MKKDALNRMRNVLKGQAMNIKDSDVIEGAEKVEELAVINNFAKFLKGYDENVRVLDEYHREKEKGGERE